MIDIKLDDEADQLRHCISNTLRLADRGLPASQTLQLADAILQSVITHLGGTRIYIPQRQDKPDWDALRAEYIEGASRDEIVRKHKISRAQFYRYVKPRRQSA